MNGTSLHHQQHGSSSWWMRRVESTHCLYQSEMHRIFLVFLAAHSMYTFEFSIDIAREESFKWLYKHYGDIFIPLPAMPTRNFWKLFRHYTLEILFPCWKQTAKTKKLLNAISPHPKLWNTSGMASIGRAQLEFCLLHFKTFFSFVTDQLHGRTKSWEVSLWFIPDYLCFLSQKFPRTTRQCLGCLTKS